MRVVDLGKKFDFLLPRYSRDKIIRELARDYFKSNRRTPAIWLTAAREDGCAEVHINNPGVKTLVRYLGAKGVEFKEECFELPIDEFIKAIRPVEKDGGYEPGYKGSSLSAALNGTYQIVRPFVDEPSKFVLEPLVITHDPQSNGCIVSGYSRNEARRGYLYRGPILIDEKWCFTTLERPHRSVLNRRIGRSLVICPAFNSDAAVIDMGDAFSGIMLRGVSGKSTHQRAVGVPFIAIQVDKHAADLEACACGTIAEGECIELRKDMFIGELNGDHRDMHTFCREVFDQLKFESANVYQTVSAAKVIRVIKQVAGKAASCREAWARMAATFNGGSV